MRLRLFFTTIQLPVDYTMLVVAAFGAYFIRFESGFVELRPAISTIPYAWYFFLSFIIPIAWIAIFAIIGLYRTEEHKFFDDIPRIIFACSTGIMFVIALIFFNREFFASRFVILAAWFLAIMFVSFGRIFLNTIYYFLRKKGYGMLRVAVVGEGRTADVIKNEYQNNYLLGRNTVMYSPQFNDETKIKLMELRGAGFLDELIYAGDPDRELHNNILLFCEENNINFKYSADFFSTSLPNISLRTVAGIPLVDIKQTGLDVWDRVHKRVFDVCGSLFLIILTMPIMFLVAFLIKLDRKFPGPIFWYRLDDGRRVKRVGEDGKLFNYFKFRTMKNNTHNMRYNELSNLNNRVGSPMVKIKEDPRVTSIGRFLRKYSIDELPEFFLVLQGRMSLVGPRPHLPEEVQKYSPHHKKTLSIKPGITGISQISGRADLAFEEEVRLNKYYIDNWSIWMDLYILLKTPGIVLRKRGAY